ncbi:hypothetical protein TNIN_102221 [Trichonephila inaurata madagascariensis]|uniref:Uncharacterized protein n=1 Tax=Trichonephila inaurata madagascariensis TaxID=2747483 RepID=A0A8X6XCQ5_9ARAC|nr:hypothetical protein TNIN_102221 [Trichonephila inaurata madagascariensis]
MPGQTRKTSTIRRWCMSISQDKKNTYFTNHGKFLSWSQHVVKCRDAAPDTTIGEGFSSLFEVMFDTGVASSIFNPLGEKMCRLKHDNVEVLAEERGSQEAASCFRELLSCLEDERNVKELDISASKKMF